jgi:hypothetical protein
LTGKPVFTIPGLNKSVMARESGMTRIATLRLSTMTIGLFKHAGVAALVAATLSTLAPAARAEQVGVIALSPVRLAAKSVAGKGEARFDWLAKRAVKPSEDAPLRTAAAPVGKGSWVCSPAGFGTKSRCYKR